MGKEVKYEEALSQLESIAARIESGDLGIDQLATELKNAQKLVKLCRDRLTKTDEEIRKLLGGGEGE